MEVRMRDTMYETICPICKTKYNITPTTENGSGSHDQIYMRFKIEPQAIEYGDFFPKCSKCKCELMIVKAKEVKQIVDSVLAQHGLGVIMKQTKGHIHIDIGEIIDVFIDEIGEELFSVNYYY
jgi:hypothetical protein